MTVNRLSNGRWLALVVLAAGCALALGPGAGPGRADGREGIDQVGAELERVTTVVPFPRGLSVVDGDLYVLARGRVRGAGGVSAKVEDLAGTIFRVALDVAEPFRPGEVGGPVRGNGSVFAAPQDPPFRLWNRAARPPERDRWTDRPYCTLRYHGGTKSFYVCAFSGIDKPRKPRETSFSKNLTDGLLRFDLRTHRWYEVERHDIEAGGTYPHHDPAHHGAPHGWLNGPDNCLPVGKWLYAVAKDNNRLVQYDLSALENDPEAGYPPSRVVLESRVDVEGLGVRLLAGQSALAYRDGWLYVGYRTSSVILRFPLDERFEPVEPIRAQLVARFDPYDPLTGHSANITDMVFDETGRLYVVSAKPASVYRFQPDPQQVFDGRSGRAEAWLDLAEVTGNPRMKSENLLVHDGYLFVTSGDGYAYQNGAAGTVYRIAIDERNDEREESVTVGAASRGSEGDGRWLDKLSPVG